MHSGLLIFVREYTSTSVVPLDDDMNTKIYDRKKIPPGRTLFSSYFYDFLFFLQIVSKLPITDFLLSVSHTRSPKIFRSARRTRKIICPNADFGSRACTRIAQRLGCLALHLTQPLTPMLPRDHPINSVIKIITGPRSIPKSVCAHRVRNVY